MNLDDISPEKIMKMSSVELHKAHVSITLDMVKKIKKYQEKEDVYMNLVASYSEFAKQAMETLTIIKREVDQNMFHGLPDIIESHVRVAMLSLEETQEDLQKLKKLHNEML